MSKIVLTTMPVPSTSFVSDPVFIDHGGDAELRYDYDRDDQVVRGGIRFETVRAYRFRAEGHCTAWHVDAYDTLVEVVSSSWVTELLDAEPSYTWGHWKINHYLLFLDGAGAFEVAAEAWSLLPEEPIG